MKRLLAIVLLCLCSRAFATDPVFVGVNALTTPAQQAKGVWFADPSRVDQGAAGSSTNKTLAYLKTQIGTTHTWVDLPPGAYTIATNFDTGAYLHLRPQPGAMVTRSGSATLAISASFQAPLTQWLSGWTAGLTISAPTTIYPQWFGATGDGVTDDTVAIVSAIAVINASGKGTLVFLPSTYIVGFASSTFAGSPQFQNVNGLLISGYGAKLKIKAGTACTSTNWGAYGLILNGCSNVRVEGLEIDGSADLLSYGPGTFDGGAIGVLVISSSNVSLCNLTIHHMGTDAIWIGDGSGAGLGLGNVSKRVSLENVYGYNVRRHGVSVIAVDDLTVLSSGFWGGEYHNGTVPDTGMGASIDVEPNIADARQYVRGARFVSTYFGTSGRAAVIAASSQKYVTGTALEDCTMENASNSAVIINNPTFRIYGGIIHGQAELNIAIMKGVAFQADASAYSGGAQTVLMGQNARNIVEDCTFTSDRNQRFVDIGGSLSPKTRKIFRNNVYTYSGNAYPDNGSLFRYFGAVTLENEYWDHVGSSPATKYSIVIDTNLTSDAYALATSCYSTAPLQLYTDQGNQSVANWRDAQLSLYKLLLYPSEYNTSIGTVASVLTYNGSPEGAVTANPGSICTDYTNGVVYSKKTGTGNTGWKLITQAP